MSASLDPISGVPSPYDSVVEDIQQKFAGLHKILDERENSMLDYVKTLKNEYFESPLHQQIQGLFDLRELILNGTRDNALMERKIAEIDSEAAQLLSGSSMSTKLNPVSWGSLGYNELCQLMNEIQFETKKRRTIARSVSDSNISRIDKKIEKKISNTSSKEDRYRCMVEPVYRGGKLGDGIAPDEISHPNHISIDENSQNIYVSDFKQNCVIVFDRKASFIDKITCGIKFPRAITCKNSKLYLIENSHYMRHVALKTFSLTPQIDLIPSKRVKIPSDLSNVSAFDVSSTENWYICNRVANKIHCFSNNAFSSFIPNSPILHPTAIRVRQIVYLLESHNNKTASIKLISLEGVILHSIPLYSIVEPLYFDLDLNNNFIVSDIAEESIVIFEKNGGLHHRISPTKTNPITRPKGIAVSAAGNIVVITNNLEGALLIF